MSALSEAIDKFFQDIGYDEERGQYLTDPREYSLGPRIGEHPDDGPDMGMEMGCYPSQQLVGNFLLGRFEEACPYPAAISSVSAPVLEMPSPSDAPIPEQDIQRFRADMEIFDRVVRNDKYYKGYYVALYEGNVLDFNKDADILAQSILDASGEAILKKCVLEFVEDK